MKIEDLKNAPPNLRTDNADSKKQAASTPKSNTASGQSEVVTISSAANQIKSLEALIAADEPFDADKVSAIKTAIANGEFKVDAEKVASGLISTVKDLLK